MYQVRHLLRGVQVQCNQNLLTIKEIRIMVTFKINGQSVQGEDGQYIKQVAEKYGIDIPTLCHHKALEPAGMCRLCTVELFDGRRTPFRHRLQLPHLGRHGGANRQRDRCTRAAS
jgi:ferredoxin